MMKLFGKTFSTSESQKGLANDTNEQQCSLDHGTNLKDNTSSYELNGKKSLAREGQIKNGNGISTERETSTSQSQENEGQGETTNSSQRQQILRKPDKIIPCPRCKSMDTKFCYYNNYNVNQPRHFCRKCQRYWTAGGIMRDVPVGSGRRSYHKQPRALHHPHNVVSNSLESTRSNDVYNFGSNISHCESTNPLGFVSDHFANPDQMGSNGGSNELLGSNCHGFRLQAPFYAVPHWPTAWPCNIPVSWPTPNSPSQSLLSSSSASSSQTLGKHSRNEAHIINASCDLKSNKDVSKENRLEGGVWVPKSLRFDDPNEASKSSIWEALGINGEKTSLINKRSIFKDFKKGVEEKNHSERTSPTLQANPAAMSRSQNFREAM